MRRAVLCCALLGALAGCASVNVLRIDDVPRAQSDPARVAVHLDAPQRPYRAIALVEVDDQGWNYSFDELRARMVGEAAKLGGDAVIVGTRTEPGSTRIIPVGSSFATTTVRHRLLVGQVIVFE